VVKMSRGLSRGEHQSNAARQQQMIQDTTASTPQGTVTKHSEGIHKRGVCGFAAGMHPTENLLCTGNDDRAHLNFS
jgi:hypothetical protein